MSEYKTKTIDLPGLHGTSSLRKIHEALPSVLPDFDEPGWEVCTVIAGQFYTGKCEIGVLYRKVES